MPNRGAPFSRATQRLMRLAASTRQYAPYTRRLLGGGRQGGCGCRGDGQIPEARRRNLLSSVPTDCEGPCGQFWAFMHKTLDDAEDLLLTQSPNIYEPYAMPNPTDDLEPGPAALENRLALTRAMMRLEIAFSIPVGGYQGLSKKYLSFNYCENGKADSSFNNALFTFSNWAKKQSGSNYSGFYSLSAKGMTDFDLDGFGYSLTDPDYDAFLGELAVEAFDCAGLADPAYDQYAYCWSLSYECAWTEWFWYKRAYDFSLALGTHIDLRIAEVHAEKYGPNVAQKGTGVYMKDDFWLLKAVATKPKFGAYQGSIVEALAHDNPNVKLFFSVYKLFLLGSGFPEVAEPTPSPPPDYLEPLHGRPHWPVEFKRAEFIGEQPKGHFKGKPQKYSEMGPPPGKQKYP